MEIKPLRDNVLIKVDKPEEKSKGGLIIPETTREKPYEGEVIEVGPGREIEDGTIKPVAVKVGDKVIFSKYFTPVSIPDRNDLVLMSEDNIIAITK